MINIDLSKDINMHLLLNMKCNVKNRKTNLNYSLNKEECIDPCKNI